MKKLLGWTAALGVALVTLQPASAAPGAFSGPEVSAAGPSLADGAELRRAEVVKALVAKWSAHVAETYRLPEDAWVSDMAATFASLPIATLELALKARTFDKVNAILVPTAAPRPKLLGDLANDLVFVPITPCRIADTRLAGGAIAANTVRSFDVTAVSDYSFQGGSATNCDGAGAAGSFAAAAFNFTVVFPAAPGYLTAFPFLGTQPVAATLNYGAGEVKGNFSVVKLDQGASASELSVFSLAQTHLVIDMVGYFIQPQATPLDCVEVSSAGVDIAAGGTGSQSTAVCPAGYIITGGGCSSSTFDGKIVTSRSFAITPTSQSHFCAFRNQGATTANFVAYGRCCRLTGR